MSPTQRARAHCKAQGWTSQIVERFNVYAKVRQDLFGVIDLVVLDGRPGGPLGVQVCAGASHAARMAKAMAEPRLKEWLAAPARFEVWSFSKRGARGKRKRWELRVEPINLDAFCQCSLRIRLAGDGCSYCNPEFYAELRREREAEGETLRAGALAK